MVQEFTDSEAYGDMPTNVSSHLVDYISVHIRFDLERYLLIMHQQLVARLR